MFLVQVVKGRKVTQTVGPMAEAEARRLAQRFADAMGSKGQVFLLPVRTNEGAHLATAVHAHDSQLTRAHYPAIFGDSNDDGLPDIDDGFGPTSHEGAPIQVEETLLSAVFDRMLAVRQGYQRQVEEFLEELRAEFPSREVSGRAKTPYSLIQKLLRSFVLDPTDRRAVFKRAKFKPTQEDVGREVVGDPIMLKDFAGTSIYAADKHDLDRVVDYVRGKYGSSIVEFEDKYAEEDASPMDKRKGYVAVHFVLLRDGVPIELQVKTQRMKRLGDASHTPMKNKTLDIPAYMGVVDVVRRADLGDETAAAQIDPLLATSEGITQLAASFTLRRNPMRAPHWSDAEYEQLADWTENPRRGHVESEWASMRRNPSAALVAAGRAALPYLRQLAASPVAQQLAADAVRAGVVAAGRVPLRRRP